MVDEWIKKMQYIYTREYFLAIKKNDVLPSVTRWMDLEGLMVNETNQTENDKYNFTYMWNLTKEQTETDSLTQRTHGWLSDGEAELGDQVAKVKALRSTNWQLRNSRGDVVNHIVIIMLVPGGH